MSVPETTAWSGLRVETRLAGGHRNEVWSGQGPSGRVAIRRSRRSAESLRWELDLLVDLHAEGFLVPRPIATDDGGMFDGDLVVQEWIDGTEPRTTDEWRLVADELRRLHDRFATRRQRPGCLTVVELDRSSRSVDADMSTIPDDVASDVLEVFASMSGAPTSVIHGDPGPSNLRITDDGRVGLLDWDESRVDVCHLDLADLGAPVLPDDEHRRAQRCADAWEVANAWVAEPAYARHRLERLRRHPPVR